MIKQNKNKIVIGVTGGLGSGKSTVARILKTRDCELIDADKLAHRSLHRGGMVYKKIVGFFGTGILKKDRNIDRQKLAGIVFLHSPALKKLNSIVHPELKKEIFRRIRSSRKRVIILDAALIIEAGLRRKLDKLVVVTAKRGQQMERSAGKLAINNRQAALRIKSQISQDEKSRFADFIIDNSGSINKTRKQVLEIRRL
ncbi:MAG: dephospho-CoA kinase, partial [Candidatus Omnitrophica bacterium]|nr:dephospho-CoA kinase [Candidatus Omnitrophota bacterium]